MSCFFGEINKNISFCEFLIYKEVLERTNYNKTYLVYKRYQNIYPKIALDS